VFREGQKDLRLTNPPSATAAQLANLGSAATAASAENFQRIGKLTKKYHAGKIPQVEKVFVWIVIIVTFRLQTAELCY